jgi:hypothetical protein
MGFGAKGGGDALFERGHHGGGVADGAAQAEVERVIEAKPLTAGRAIDQVLFDFERLFGGELFIAVGFDKGLDLTTSAGHERATRFSRY